MSAVLTVFVVHPNGWRGEVDFVGGDLHDARVAPDTDWYVCHDGDRPTEQSLWHAVVNAHEDGSLWEPELDCVDDEDVGDAICEWHVARGETPPADSLFGLANWERPVGTSMQDYGGYCGEKLARVLRVTLGGHKYLLAVGWDNVCGCGECRGRPTYDVTEAVPC